MAGDSLTTCDGYHLASNRKVHRCEDGRIFGVAGLSTDAVKFRRYMLGGDETRPTMSDEFCALILNTDGTVDWMDKEWELVRYIVPAAIGSGQELAQGAMLAGANPGEAVAIAARLDRKTGGDIHIEGLPA